MVAPVNNDVIDNDVAPSHQRHQVDSVKGIESIEEWMCDSHTKKYRDITKYRYQTFTSKTIL